MTQPTPNPQAEAYASLWMEECQRHAESRIRFISAMTQNREYLARAEAAEKELAALRSPVKTADVVELHPESEQDEFGPAQKTGEH